MKYIELDVRTTLIVHGYDDNNDEIVQEVGEQDYMTKLIPLERILSLSENYLLVAGSHGRVMYWEYRGTMAEVKRRLESAGLVIL